MYLFINFHLFFGSSIEFVVCCFMYYLHKYASISLNNKIDVYILKLNTKLITKKVI